MVCITVLSDSTPDATPAYSPEVETSPAFRVAILDDHRSFGEAISMALNGFDDIAIIGVVSSTDALVELAHEHDPDVLLIDYQLTDGTGIDCATRVDEEGIAARLILLTAHASLDVTSRALKSGFEKVLSKEAPLTDIVQAVRSQAEHHTMAGVKQAIHFSRRQREVLDLMGQGLDPASIAEELFISVHTARSHVKDVMRIVGASTQLAAVTKAIREGYLLPPSKHDTRPVE